MSNGHLEMPDHMLWQYDIMNFALSEDNLLGVFRLILSRLIIKVTCSGPLLENFACIAVWPTGQTFVETTDIDSGLSFLAYKHINTANI